MIVKDIILSAVMALGRADLVEYIATEESENADLTQKDIDVLVNCYNNVQNEIALNYVKLKANELITTVDGKVNYSSLANDIVEVLSVSDSNDKALHYEIFASYLQTKAGAVNVVYAYAPEKKTLTDTVEFSGFVTERLLSYGVAAEYSLICGAYQDAVEWDKRYKEAITKATLKKPIGRIMSRSWI